MTVQEAQERYVETKEATSGFRELIGLLINSGFTHPFSNDSYLDALNLTEVMLSHTNSDLLFLTGSGADGFLTHLTEPFRGALKRIENCKGQARIVILGDPMPSVPSALQKFQSEFSTSLKVATAKPLARLQHFIVCDSKIVRVEEYHEPLNNSSMASEIKAKVHFNNPSLANMLRTVFDGIWNVVKK